MTKKKKNSIWAFFASVKLALFLLFTLAVTSILGTLIQQNESPEIYVREYGPNMANLLQTLNITDMYNSWWFLALLGLFSLNLIVCSLERIPTVIRIVRKDNLAVGRDRLAQMGIRKTLVLDQSLAQSKQVVADFLARKGWKASAREHEDGILLFAQKGGWTRFGVYIVHLSILVILLGAVIGSSNFAARVLKKPDFAFKGSIMVPETRETDFIYAFQSGERIDLGFSVRCDFFNIEYYSNGMPKTYLSKLTVIDQGKEVLSTDLEVNTPLTYNGITFYQSSYQPYSDLVVRLVSKSTGKQKADIISAGRQVTWPELGATFGILRKEQHRQVVKRVKVWFSDNEGSPSIFWIDAGREARIKRPSGEYSMTVKQLYATGLQVTRDPGVWFVYTGCGMMLLGLFVAFFMSHRKVYAFLREEEGRTTVLFAGSAHKNKTGFERTFASLVDSFRKDIS